MCFEIRVIYFSLFVKLSRNRYENYIKLCERCSSFICVDFNVRI